LELFKELASGYRAGDITSIHQHRHQAGIALRVAPVEVNRARQFGEGPIILAEMQFNVPEKSVRDVAEFVELDRLSREIACSRQGLRTVLRDGLVRRAADEIRKAFDVADILVLSPGAKPADRHVLDQSPA
jgi:hypothetical protein